jgi:hypothetical protein
MAETLRIGIIGYGYTGKQPRAIRAQGDVQIAAIVARKITGN